MTPIEGAARAVREELNPAVLSSGRDLVEQTMDGEDYAAIARAVIAAIREPSDHILLEMREPLGTHSDGFAVSHTNRDSWRAGIDAALAEGE